MAARAATTRIRADVPGGKANPPAATGLLPDHPLPVTGFPREQGGWPHRTGAEPLGGPVHRLVRVAPAAVPGAQLQLAGGVAGGRAPPPPRPPPPGPGPGPP